MTCTDGRREVSAGMVVLSGGEVLVIRNRFGEWVLPKGKVEPGERLEDAAIREVMEETGVQAEVLGPAGRSEYTYRSESTGEEIPKVVYWFAGRPARSGPGAESAPPARPQAEEGISAAEFVPLAAACALLKYDGELVRRVADRECARERMRVRARGPAVRRTAGHDREEGGRE